MRQKSADLIFLSHSEPNCQETLHLISCMATNARVNQLYLAKEYRENMTDSMRNRLRGRISTRTLSFRRLFGVDTFTVTKRNLRCNRRKMKLRVSSSPIHILSLLGCQVFGKLANYPVCAGFRRDQSNVYEIPTVFA